MPLLEINSLIQKILVLLISFKNTLNQINVFPIADKDTGDNLYRTLSLENCETLEDVKNQILMKARGSSGNILALYVMGLWENKSDNLYEMCSKAAQFTWDTMYEPVEGTMLTAMKDVPKEYASLEDFIYKYIENTQNNLMKGPDLLPVLKENNTLDSGTLGFLYILCGIYKGLTDLDVTPEINVAPVNSKVAEEDFKHCVEVLLDISQENHELLIEELKLLGNELIILRQDTKSKIHIHTNDFNSVILKSKLFGILLEEKIDNNKI